MACGRDDTLQQFEVQQIDDENLYYYHAYIKWDEINRYLSLPDKKITKSIVEEFEEIAKEAYANPIDLPDTLSDAGGKIVDGIAAALHHVGSVLGQLHINSSGQIPQLHSAMLAAYKKYQIPDVICSSEMSLEIDRISPPRGNNMVAYMIYCERYEKYKGRFLAGRIIGKIPHLECFILTSQTPESVSTAGKIDLQGTLIFIHEETAKRYIYALRKIKSKNFAIHPHQTDSKKIKLPQIQNLIKSITASHISLYNENLMGKHPFYAELIKHLNELKKILQEINN